MLFGSPVVGSTTTTTGTGFFGYEVPTTILPRPPAENPFITDLSEGENIPLQTPPLNLLKAPK
jgi:hypothetical protein